MHRALSRLLVATAAPGRSPPDRARASNGIHLASQSDAAAQGNKGIPVFRQRPAVISVEGCGVACLGAVVGKGVGVKPSWVVVGRRPCYFLLRMRSFLPMAGRRPGPDRLAPTAPRSDRRREIPYRKALPGGLASTAKT